MARRDQKLKVEIRRLKQRGYDRKYTAKLKAKNQKLKRMIANANQEQAELKVESNIQRMLIPKQEEYNRSCASKKKEPKCTLANANQEQAARKVETKNPRTVDYPRKTRLAPDIAALTPAEVRQIWYQTYGAERSLWRVRSRLRAERASDQSTSRLIAWIMREDPSLQVH